MIAEAIHYFAGHPVEFTKQMIGISPDPIQAEIMQAVAANPLVSVRSGHGIGKSALQSWLIIWFLCTRAFPKVPCTAPTKHQLYDILWAEVAKWMYNNPVLRGELVWTYEKLYMRGYPENWFAVPRTASKPDALQGFHADDVFYVIDEASGVDDAIFEPVLGALSTAGAKLLMCGNPTQLSGFFYESHHKDRALYQVFKVSSIDSPRVSDDYVQLIIDMFGEDSDVYRIRVAGEFPSALPDSFISLAWVEKCSTKTLPVVIPGEISIGV
ncbi:MAG: terminase, partial [Symbiobacteriaceae bacterium]|nr:terminase [Symbiobacteriaceae bacterium]